jgi:hypothetical protein
MRNMITMIAMDIIIIMLRLSKMVIGDWICIVEKCIRTLGC